MRGDREECGVHSAPPSALHQQPHNGGVYAYQCTPTLLLNLYVCCFGWWLHGWLAFSDLPQVGWLGWGHREVSTRSEHAHETVAKESICELEVLESAKQNKGVLLHQKEAE